MYIMTADEHLYKSSEPVKIFDKMKRKATKTREEAK